MRTERISSGPPIASSVNVESELGGLIDILPVMDGETLAPWPRHQVRPCELLQ